MGMEILLAAEPELDWYIDIGIGCHAIIVSTYRSLEGVPEDTVVMSVVPESLQNAIGDTLYIGYIDKDQNTNDHLDNQNEEQERGILQW